MHPNESLIHSFYEAFQKRDYRAMQEAYHPGAKFHDPVFQHLNAEEVKAMWQMLLTTAKDLRISYSNVHADDTKGSCHWEAWYTFSKTNRPVHNIIEARFEFKNGKIQIHEDHFDLWAWSKQALGISGFLLGWTPMVQSKIRQTAQHAMKKYS
jgi:limonene-1,2-epoxide hydrolase